MAQHQQEAVFWSDVMIGRVRIVNRLHNVRENVPCNPLAAVILESTEAKNRVVKRLVKKFH